MTEILAIDIATDCGFARGLVDGTPIWGSVRFGKAGASNNAIFWNALKWISQVLEPRPRPDIMIMEGLLPPVAKVGHTSRKAIYRLAGLHGVIRGVAYGRGIGEIAEASVGDIRGHFICDRRLQSAKAKRKVMQQCEMLGWTPQNYDESDALALWHYACSLVDPKIALQVVPIFEERRMA